MDFEISLKELRTRARRAGLELGDEELQRLLAGVNRSVKQAIELRAFIADKDEPATVFAPSRGRSR